MHVYFVYMYVNIVTVCETNDGSVCEIFNLLHFRSTVRASGSRGGRRGPMVNTSMHSLNLKQVLHLSAEQCPAHTVLKSFLPVTSPDID